MKSISGIILLGFISLSLFGFLGMLGSSNMAHGPKTCIASLAQNGDCPPEQGMALALFHINALKVFSTIVLSGLAFFFVFAFLSLTFVSALRLVPRTKRAVLTISDIIRSLFSEFLALLRLRYALALHELSPTYS